MLTLLIVLGVLAVKILKFKMFMIAAASILKKMKKSPV